MGREKEEGRKVVQREVAKQPQRPGGTYGGRERVKAASEGELHKSNEGRE